LEGEQLAHEGKLLRSAAPFVRCEMQMLGGVLILLASLLCTGQTTHKHEFTRMPLLPSLLAG